MRPLLPARRAPLRPDLTANQRGPDGAVKQREPPAKRHNDSRTPSQPPKRCLTDDGRPCYPRSDLNRPPETAQAPLFAGLDAARNGKVNCPFHDDADPSLQLYEDGTFYCFGCGAGGSIYDFAARLWHTGTKGREFLALRERLHAELRP